MPDETETTMEASKVEKAIEDHATGDAEEEVALEDLIVSIFADVVDRLDSIDAKLESAEKALPEEPKKAEEDIQEAKTEVEQLKEETTAENTRKRVTFLW